MVVKLQNYSRLDYSGNLSYREELKSIAESLSNDLRRAFDVLFSITALIVTSPLLLFLGLLIRLKIGSPVVYAQKRIGKDGKEFTLYKFRTLKVCETASEFKPITKDDCRMTRFGSFLRKTSLDELPNFFNVLKGDMAIVGPRALATKQDRELALLIPYYSFRHNVKPGITGPVQISPNRAEFDSIDLITKRVGMDINYIRNRTFATDLKIILATLLVVVFDQNSY